MRNVLLPAILLLGTTITACRPNSGYKYNDGTFPTTPTNLGSINSIYDDYNSTIPIVGTSTPLVFSSNRGSQGQNFDFVFKWIDIIRSKSDGTYTIGESSTVNYMLDSYSSNTNIDYAISRVNSGADELGPCLISLGSARVQMVPGTFVSSVAYYVFLYASNSTGNLDISFSENKTTGTHEKPVSLSFLNSAKDDAYPCITKDSSAIYFCSNRDGNFDIYKARLPINGKGFLTTLKDNNSAYPVTKEGDLSSGYDDKCPFIMGTTLIFTSNRPGGFGGYDLYYSRFENDKWTAPVNFGPTINTAADEYRPILMDVGFTNNFMLFSSNRPGGKGGFDLYYAGIDK